ncbi:MAG: hypothetical protein II863_04365 [Kiritimatiellae bacterium]|nr:hypothetical protein [Kiritimatiellia bacterium]
MKKLMIVAVVSMAAVGAFAVESANIVGYSGKTTGSDNNFVTIPFNAVGYNTSDIQQIKISDGGAGTIGYGTEVFSVWEGLPTAVEGADFFYYDPSMSATGEETDYFWGDGEGNRASFSIAPGQAVVVNCAADLTFTTSGQVPSEPAILTTVQDNNFIGNPFPQTIDIQAIKISDGEAGTIGYGTEVFSVWEGLPTAVEGVDFFYYDPSMSATGEETDYFWGDGEGNKAEYSIAPGQGVVINCAEGLTITIEPPYSL